MEDTFITLVYINFEVCIIKTNEIIYYSTVAVRAQTAGGCQIPLLIRGAWFSWEHGQKTLTEINADSMTMRGTCVNMIEEFHVNYTFVFRDANTPVTYNSCYHCVKLIVRTVNVLEKLEGKSLYANATYYMQK